MTATDTPAAYTVLLMLPDYLASKQPDAAGAVLHLHVTGSSAEQALSAAYHVVTERFPEEDDPENTFVPVTIYAGHLDNLYDLSGGSMTVSAPAVQEAVVLWSDLAQTLIETDMGPIMNHQRAARAAASIFPGYDRWGAREAIYDVLADIRHLADLMDWSFRELDKEAYRRYSDDTVAVPVAQDTAFRAAIERDL